jgi:formylglycine-generating enzyme required for sulfatase activity
MSEAMPLQPEQSFARGRFVLVKRLGRGGMGEVWLARDERLREPVALKFLPPEIRGDAGALDDLCRETARSHKLSHANIVRIHDLYEDPDGMAFIVMEYIDGPTLAALRLQQPSRVLSWEYLRPLVAQLCAALEYAHGEKVIHRDLKPANLMVDSRGRLKLADFGIAAVASDSMSRISMRHSTSGTLPYMSPQQLMGKRPQAADDIYALGATLYELLTGKPPFHTGDITHQVLHQAPEPMEDRLAELGMANDIPPDAAALIMACLAKEPGQRPQSARAVAEWIGLALEGKPTAESLAAALFPQTPPAPTPLAAGKPEREGRSTPARFGRNLAAIGIVSLVMAAAFWLRTGIHGGDHSMAGMSLIPAGSFTMGDSLDGERDAIPAVTVTVSAFYMDVNLVSYNKWQSVYGWANSHGYEFNNAGLGKAANHPVVWVNWYDTVKWCNARSQQAGLTPVYYTEAGLKHVYTGGECAPYANWKANGYRLPTEAEWEKAARGGLKGQRFPWGNTVSQGQANYYGDTSYDFDLGPNGYNANFRTGGASPPYTSPVGYFGANGYGLYDMAGNVSEWCWDWTGTPYAGGSNPRGPNNGIQCVLRGGSWDNSARLVRCACRNSQSPSGTYGYIGFRCVRSI